MMPAQDFQDAGQLPASLAPYTVGNELQFSMAAVPNLFGTRDQFRGRQFSHGPGAGVVQAIMRVMGSDGERQTKLYSLDCCSPPAVRPGS